MAARPWRFESSFPHVWHIRTCGVRPWVRFDSVAGEYVGTHVADHVTDNFFPPRKNGRPWFVEGEHALGNNTRALELGDLDGDGDLDVFVSCGNWPGGSSCSQSTIWLNDGSGNLVDSGQRLLDEAWSVAIGGVDGDRDLDIVTGRYMDGVEDNSAWEEGDWNNDGDFDNLDLVTALQEGLYQRQSA